MVYRNLIGCFAVALSVMSAMGGDRLPDGINYTEKVGDYTWTFKVENGEATIGCFDEWGNGERAVEPQPQGELTIPETLGGCPVVGVGSHAIYDCDSMTTVSMPNSVKDVGYYAFHDCNSLRSVDLGNSLTNIGDYAFCCAPMTEISIPASVVSIGENAFRDDWQLRDLTVDADNPNYSSDDGVLYDKSKETIYFWPQQKEIEIPDGVRNIVSYAFYSNDASQNRALTLPSSVTNIGACAFADCNLASVCLNEGLRYIDGYAFEDNFHLRAVVIPSTVIDFGYVPFRGCTRLKALFFKGDAPGQSEYDWYHCYFDEGQSNLVLYVASGSKGWAVAGSDELPERWPVGDTGVSCEVRSWIDYPNVPYYPMVKFDLGPNGIYSDDWNSLEQVVEPGGAAIAPEITVPDGMAFLGWDVDFTNVTTDMTVRAQYEIFDETSGRFAVRRGGIAWWGNLYWTVDGDRYLWVEAVSGIIGNGRMEIPESLNGISIRGFSRYAFRSCEGLKEVVLPDVIESVNGAFCGCSTLTNIVVSETNPNFYFENGCLQGRDQTLYWCDENKSEVVIPEGVIRLGQYICTENNEIEKIVLPTTLAYYSGGEFVRCPKLKMIEIASGNVNFTFEDGVLYYLMDGVKRDVLMALQSLTSVTLADTVNTIQGWVFGNNTNLTEIVIPASVTSIGYDVFNGCVNLKSVYFEGNAPWSYGVFYGAPADLVAYVREGSCGWAGEGSFELPEYWPNNQDSYWGRPVCRWEGSEPIRYTVRFDIGKYGLRTGGGELEQSVIGGKDATTPIVEANDGFTFVGWDADAMCVLSDMTVRAKYKRIGALEDGVHTETVDGYTWTFKIENCEATIGCFDEWGNVSWQRAVEPEPAGELTIPGMLGGCSVVALGCDAFVSCGQLNAVTIPDSICDLQSDCFSCCYGLNSLQIPEGVTNLGDWAFCNCNLKAINLPDGLLCIGDGAFHGTYLRDICIPKTVVEIGEGAFALMNGEGLNITVDPANEKFSSQDGALYDKLKEVLLAWPRTRRIDLKEGLRKICRSVFNGNTGNMGASITLPSSLEEIGDSAFANCDFASIDLNEGLLRIGMFAFSGNGRLRHVIIPSTVVEMAQGVFASCENLSRVFFAGNAPNSYLDRYVYSSTSLGLVTYVRPRTVGWKDPGSTELPDVWPQTNELGDVGEQRPICEWVTYPNPCCRVSFDIKQYADRVGGGELEQLVPDGEPAIAPELNVHEGARFAGWNCDFSCVTTSLKVTAIFVNEKGEMLPSYFVSSEGSDANDGLTDETAFLTIQHAIECAWDGDVIEVDDGVYGPIRVSDGDKRLLIRSKHGASFTSIDGGGVSRSATLGNTTNVVLQGFSVCNGHIDALSSDGVSNEGAGVWGGVLVDCVVSNNEVAYFGSPYWAYGGGASRSTLKRCVIADNRVSAPMGVCGGGTYECVLENCLLAGNSANSEQEAYGGGAAWSELYNCTVVDNIAESLYASAGGGGCYCGTAVNTVSVGNQIGDTAYEWGYWGWDFYSVDEKFCFDGTYEDPQFVDPENGDYRLSAVSPCVDAGCNDRIRGETDLIGECRVQNGIVDIGAYEGGYVVPPTVPGDLSVTEEKAGSIELSWAASRFSEGYVIYRANRNSFAKASQIATTAEAAFEDYDVNSDYTYYYWVCATNAYAQSEMSDSVSGTCTDPISVLTTDADLSGAVEMEPFSIQLSANGGVSPYVWTGTLPGYYIERTSSTFKECGKPRGLRKMSVEADYVLPFDFVLADGRASPYVHFSSDGWLEIRSNSTLWDYEMLASFDLSGGNWLVATEPTDDVYVDEESDIVTFRWQRKFGDDVSMAANFSISLCRDGRVVAKYGDGNDLIDTMQYGIGDDCWGEVEVSAFCDDIVLMPIGMPPGLNLSDDGVLSGTPLKPGAYQFVVQAEGESGGTGYKWLTINIAENANKRPLVAAIPDAATVKVMVDEGKTFSVVAQDPEGGELTYRWLVDGEEIDNDSSEYKFEPTLEDDMRHHTIECWVSDDLWQDDNATRVKWDVNVFRTLHVDVERGLAFPEDEESPVPDGSSDRPYKYLEDAMCYAGFGDVVEVGPGSHRLSWVNEGVLVKSTNGRAVTFIESELGESIGGDRYSGSAVEGFTFVNYVVESLAIRDSIIRDVKSDWDYAVYDCELLDCVVCGNVCDDFVVQSSKLTNCTVAGNKSVYGGGVRGCDVTNSIVWNNQNQDGNVVNYSEPEDEYDYDGLCIFENTCVWPIQEGGGNTQDDPLFVDSFWHDYRLRVGSSAVGMGAGFLDHDVLGFVLSARIKGNGDVEPHTVVVSPNGSALFTVASSIRPLVCFGVGEARHERVQSVTINDIQNDGIITAVFSNYTFYVDATNGDDSNDGLSKEKAFASIQPALDRALNGERILVNEGAYAPITGFGRKVQVVAVDGAEKTIIDASMSCNSCSCANLGSRERASNEPGAYGDWYGTNTVLRGFTLTGGNDLLGGGAIGGTLEDCIIRGNVATVYGGGVFASVCRRCLIVDNSVEYDGNYYLVMDKYLWQMEKWRYRKNKGESYPGDWDYGYFVGGGGAFGAELYNCTVVNNNIFGDDVALFGYGTLHCRSDHTIIICNNGEDCEFPIANIECVLAEDDDPMFADPDNGDFRLRSGSPYVVNGEATVGCYLSSYFDLPGVPMNVAATEDEPCRIVISWDAAEFAETYLVYRATKNSFEKSECLAEVSDCFFIDRPADIIPEYYYWVQGKNLGGVGEVSDAALGWCDIEVEPDAVDNPVFEPSSEYYSDFCQWAVMNGVVGATGTNYAGQVRAAAVGLDAKGEPIWHDYIAGTSVSDRESVFTAKIEFADGKVKITWSPRLTKEKESMRVYKTYHKTSLVEKDWSLMATSPDQVFDVSDFTAGFFKVEVDMKH